LELELPQLLAPDLPSSCYSSLCLDSIHHKFRWWKASGIAAVRRCLTRRFLHWAICAPAARLSSGSHFSGSLSGIEPWFSVTRDGHCGPRHHSPSW